MPWHYHRRSRIRPWLPFIIGFLVALLIFATILYDSRPRHYPLPPDDDAKPTNWAPQMMNV